ncbi:site-2 protease family protein [Candidatus Woesearchaeota archaeon]|nr:site-2 protease family protein [Candidatus Woesearchaeota archaeon]
MKRIMIPQLRPSQPIKIGPYTTSKIEILDIIKSWIAISIAVAIAGLIPNSSLSFIEKLIFAGITVGIAFILHELAHKIAAQYYGCFAEFRSQDFMLILAILMSFSGFIFFAPGAVLIAGPVGRRRNGIISIAGPATNFAIAIVFAMLLVYVNIPYLVSLFTFGYLINAWIGLFNLIPFWLFDGKKILAWSKPAYYGMLAFGLLLLFSQDIIIGLVG